MKDLVKVADRLRILAINGASREVIADVLAEAEGDSVSAEGFFSAVCRERGKLVPGTRRQGHNIWTLTGREYSAQVQSYLTYIPAEGKRTDRMKFIGFGTGSQPEVSSVTSLVTPIPYNASNHFLAQVALPTYPLSPTLSSVRYARTFSDQELSVSGTVVLSEAGLFTDGDPGSNFVPGTRDIDWADALLQAPNAYKTFEPLSKTQNFELETYWEIRF